MIVKYTRNFLKNSWSSSALYISACFINISEKGANALVRTTARWRWSLVNIWSRLSSVFLLVWGGGGSWESGHIPVYCRRQCSAAQSQKAVPGYFSSRQLPHLGLAGRYCPHQGSVNKARCMCGEVNPASARSWANVADVGPGSRRSRVHFCRVAGTRVGVHQIRHRRHSWPTSRSIVLHYSTSSLSSPQLSAPRGTPH